MQDVRMTLGSPVGLWLVVVLCILLAFWIFVDLRHTWHAVQLPGRRWTLVGLRVLTGSLVALLFLQPQWLLESLQQAQGRAAVLVDVSRSMSLQDTGGRTRAEEARQVVERLAGIAPEPAFYTFGSELQSESAVELRKRVPSHADQTRIAAALEQARQVLGRELGALVLVSDGADSGGGLSAQALEELGVRVHTVGVGGAGPQRDDAIVEVRADPLAFLRQQAEVEVLVQRTPPERGTLTVSLRSGGELLTEVEAIIDSNGQGRVVIPFEVSQLGRAAYTVGIPVAEADAIPQNNERAFLMRVKRDRLRVLLVCGRPGWDARFLRAFLKGNPSIDLITFFILRTANDMSMAAPDELSLIPFPTNELFQEHLDSFDLVLFQDFNYGPYQMARYLPRVRDYVEQGGSFAMIGGELSFSAGGYAGTPVAEILPVALPPGGAQTLSEEAFRPRVHEGMFAHPLVELAPSPAESAQRWNELAEAQGSNLLGPPRPGMSVLLVHPTLQGQDGSPRPVLVVGPEGKGRTMALAIDSSYRWGITTAGQWGDASNYERFWDRALRWLTRDPLLEAAQVHTDRERYGPRAAIEVDFLVRDGRYVPPEDGAVRLSVLDEAGETLGESQARADSQGRGEGRLMAPEAPGAYRVRAEAEGGISAEESFVVEAGGQELSRPFPDHALLRRIAERTGGTFYTPASADLEQFERSHTQSLGVERQRPMAHPLFFFVAAGFFMLEWVLRRRWGLR